MIREQQEDEIEMLPNKVAYLQFSMISLPERFVFCHPQSITWSRTSLKNMMDCHQLENI